MSLPDYETESAWTSDDHGHVFTIKAIEKVRIGRILAKINIHVGVDVNFDLHQALGTTARQEVEKAAARALDAVVIERYSEPQA